MTVNRGILALLLVLFGVGLGVSISRLDFISPSTLAAQSNSRHDTDNTITLGVGINGLTLGMSEEAVRKKLGDPDPPEVPKRVRESDRRGALEEWKRVQAASKTQVLFYRLKGIRCVIDEGRLTILDFMFRGKTYASFDGTTNKGVGMWSTVNDVTRAYGRPITEGKVIVDDYSVYELRYPKSEKQIIEKELGGTVFQFREGELVFIRFGEIQIAGFGVSR